MTARVLRAEMSPSGGTPRGTETLPLTYRLPCSDELYAQSMANGRLSMLKIGTPIGTVIPDGYLASRGYTHIARTGSHLVGMGGEGWAPAPRISGRPDVSGTCPRCVRIHPLVLDTSSCLPHCAR